MKKLTVFILCFLMLIMLALPLYADVDAGTLMVVETSARYIEEMDAVEQAVRVSDSIWDKYLGYDRDDVEYSLMYQIYYLKMKDIISAYENDGSFADNISDKYYWVVPSYTEGAEVQVVRSEQNLSGWDIRRGTRYRSNISLNYPEVDFGIASIYGNILSQYPEADKYSFRFVYEEGTDVHLMYFMADEREYVVPYFPSEDLKWAVKGKIYPAGEYIELMRTGAANESSLIDEPAPIQRSEKLYLNYLVIGSAAVICVVVVAVIVAKKRKSQ